MKFSEEEEEGNCGYGAFSEAGSGMEQFSPGDPAKRSFVGKRRKEFADMELSAKAGKRNGADFTWGPRETKFRGERKKETVDMELSAKLEAEWNSFLLTRANSSAG